MAALVVLVGLWLACPVAAQDAPSPQMTPQEGADAADTKTARDALSPPQRTPGAGEATQDKPIVVVEPTFPDIQPPATTGLGTATPTKPLGTAAQAAAAKSAAGKRKRGFAGFLQRADLFQGVNISGQNTFTLQQHDIQGAEGTFESQRWDTDTLVHQSSLHLEGPVWKELVFRADISASGWGPKYSRWVAGYTGHDTALLFGDLDLALAGNEFVGFRKSTKGWQLDQKLPSSGFLRGFYTREKGVVQNQTIVGNDTAGPYFLTYTPVIEGSEVVKVNEEFMTFGEDYRLDYDSGQLYFEPLDGQPRIVTAADTISVSYQSLGYLNQGPGQLYGLRAEMPLMNDRLLLGLTTLQQDRAGDSRVSDTVGYQEDIYQGNNTTGPFDTNFRPIIPDGTSVVYKGQRQIIDEPLVVLVDSVQQIEGADYDSYRSIGRVIFRRAVPPTALVVIRYFYDIGSQSSSQTGDQSVWGVDLAYQLAKGLNMGLDWATSSADADGSSGDAMSTTVDYAGGDLHLLGEYRSIDPTYKYVDSVGFRRREKGYNLGGEWRVNKNITISDRYSNLDSDSGLSFGYSGYGGGSSFVTSRGVSTSQSNSSTALDINTARNDLSVRFDFDGWPTLDYGRNSMSNSGGSIGNSDSTTDSLNLRYSAPDGKLTMQTSFNRSQQRNLGETSTTTGETVLRGSDSDQFRASVSYMPSTKLSLSASYADNQSSAIETVNASSSNNVQLTASWRPSSTLSIGYSRSQSTSDGRVSSGLFTSGSLLSAGTLQAPLPAVYAAADFNPGGGGGDDDDDDDIEERPSIEDSSDNVNMNWRPSDKLSLDLNFGRRNYGSTGSQGYLADSVQEFWNFGTVWQMSDALSLNLSVGYDDMQFTEEDRGTVKNRSYILSGGYRPPGKNWSTGLTLNIQDGSSPTYVGYGRLQSYRTVPTKLFDLSGQLSYAINEDLTLTASAGISDFSSGYSDFRKNNADIRARYRLNGTTGLDVGYRFIKHISRTGEDSLVFGTSGSGQNYIANTFLLSLSTSFRGGLGGSSRGLGSGYGSGGGFSGGPGTFGGYTPGLQTGRYGGSYGSGPASGFGSSQLNSYRTGYGPSQFDTLSAANMQQRGISEGMFGTGDPWAGTSGRSTTRTAPGGITSGIGEFRKQDRSTRQIGKPRPQQTAIPGKEGAAIRAQEDWWLLGDNMANW